MTRQHANGKTDLVVPNHVKAGNTQLINGNLLTTVFNVESSIVESVFETVGPTGSGADNIWPDMDLIPANATIIIADVVISLSTSVAGPTTLGVAVVAGDVVTPLNTLGYGQVLEFVLDEDANVLGNSGVSHRVYIPLGATNQDFHMTWNTIGGDSESILMYYRGFMTD